MLTTIPLSKTLVMTLRRTIAIAMTPLRTIESVVTNVMNTTVASHIAVAIVI